MQEEQPRGDSAPDDDAVVPAPDGQDAARAGEADDVTEGGYRYSLVEDEAGADAVPADVAPPPARDAGGRSPLLLAAVAIVPAVIVGGLAWLAFSVLMGGGGDGRERSEQNVGNVINVFSQGQTGAIVNRYEGRVAPGFPDELPVYPGSKVVASVVQIVGDDANYLVVYDTGDDRESVSRWLVDALDEDPWQLDAGQTGASSTLHRFTRIDDPDVTGLVLSAESDSDALTTIVFSVEVTSGGPAASDSGDFTPGASKPLPEGFPDEVPVYPDGTVVESAFQKQPQANSFSLTVVTTGSITEVIEFYTKAFEDNGWTVETQDASQAPLDNAEGLSFSSEDDGFSGAIFAGEHPQDDTFTQIELQVVVSE